MKQCNTCKETKEISAFRFNNRAKGILKPQCNPCENLRMRDDRQKNGEARRTYDRNRYSRRSLEEATQNKQRLYGLAPLDAFRAIEAPGCEICGEGNGTRLLVVDHCHESGNNRGILCDRCNLAIGNMRDDPERLRRAAEYVERGGFGFFGKVEQ